MAVLLSLLGVSLWARRVSPPREILEDILYLGSQPSDQGRLFQCWVVRSTAVDTDEASLTLKTRRAHLEGSRTDLERYGIGIVVCDV